MNGLSNPTIPEIPIPKAPDPQTNPTAYLRSIHAVRDRSKAVLEKAKKNQLRHFTVDLSKFPDTVSYVVSIIKVRARWLEFCSESFIIDLSSVIRLQAN